MTTKTNGTADYVTRAELDHALAALERRLKAEINAKLDLIIALLTPAQPKQ